MIAGGKKGAGLQTDGDVGTTARVGEERVVTDGGIEKAGGVAKERGRTEGTVGRPGVVAKEGELSGGRVGHSRGVAEKRSNAGGRIFIPAVKHKSSSAHTGVVVAGSKAIERKPTNCCVEAAGGAAKQRLLPLRRVAVWIAAVRRRTDSESFRGSRKEERECDEE